MSDRGLKFALLSSDSDLTEAVDSRGKSRILQLIDILGKPNLPPVSILLDLFYRDYDLNVRERE